MKLLFIENRYKTYFYDEICKHLEKEHEIYWIVQNPKFLPQPGDIYSFPFPSKKTKINKDCRWAQRGQPYACITLTSQPWLTRSKAFDWSPRNTAGEVRKGES